MIRRAFVLVLTLAFAGCATVPPYERENLAQPGMDMSRRVAEDRFEGHGHNAREATSGGASTTGGGCGCN